MSYIIILLLLITILLIVIGMGIFIMYNTFNEKFYSWYNITLVILVILLIFLIMVLMIIAFVKYYSNKSIISGITESEEYIKFSKANIEWLKDPTVRNKRLIQL